MKIFSWLWEYLKRYKLKVISGLVLGIVATALGLVPQYLFGTVVDNVIISEGPISDRIDLLYKLLLIIFVATLIRVMFQYISRINFEGVSQSLLRNVRKTMYENIGKYDIRFFDKNRTGDIMAKMTGDLQMIRHFVAGVIFTIATSITQLIVSVVILLSINVKMTIIVLLLAPFLYLTNRKLSKIIFPIFSSIREQFSNLNTVVQENISGNRVIKAFAREDFEMDKFSKENEEFKKRNIKAAKTWGKYIPLTEFQTGLLSLIVILVGGIFVIEGDMSYGELVQFNAYIFAIAHPMRMSAWIINDIQRFLAAGQKVKTLIDYSPDIQDPKEPVEKEIKGKIEFRNVKFQFDNEVVLKNINLEIKPGMKVGVVGPTGSGKSTLVSLISRLYDPTKGKVFIDDINVKRYSLDHLRKNISYTFQDVFLFSDTIEGNIAYGRPKAPIEDVYNSAKIAGAKDFIEETDDGFDMIVGERGVGLSGGQKQRISLARALLYDTPILILDDTTSAVDLETEERIQKSLREVSSDKTTIIIAHRISSVKDSDLILVMDKGEIIQKGTHDELIRQEGYYGEICEEQMGKVGENIG